MEVGSQRPAIEDKSAEKTFSVIKKGAKSTLKIANIGAVQLNYGYGVKECQAAVDMIDADALALHFNALQEAIQPEGNTNFADLLKKIRAVCKGLSVPVIGKEVGCGISRQVAQKLMDAGVEVIDVGGYGGTSWNLIEGYRADDRRREMSQVFAGWGIPTAASLLEIRDLDCQKIASGGIRTGIDVAKSIALGADMVGMALPLLKALEEDGEKGVEDCLTRVISELKLAMFLVGAGSIGALKEKEYRVLGKTNKWAAQIA
jgi:isopentenyl-diphosphate delta-isomerase